MRPAETSLLPIALMGGPIGLLTHLSDARKTIRYLEALQKRSDEKKKANTHRMLNTETTLSRVRTTVRRTTICRAWHSSSVSSNILSPER